VTTATVTRHACPGFRPQPLASYLAGLDRGADGVNG
jgi:hypothetical protein